MIELKKQMEDILSSFEGVYGYVVKDMKDHSMIMANEGHRFN